MVKLIEARLASVLGLRDMTKTGTMMTGTEIKKNVFNLKGV